MHISLADFIFIQAVDPLHLGKRSESGHGTDLGLSAGEHGGAMHSGDDIHLCRQRTDLVDGTAIRTLVILQNHLADRFLLVLIDCLTQKRKPFFLIRERLLQLLRDLTDIFLTNLLYVREYCLFHLCGRNDLTDGCKQLLRNCTAGIGMLRLSNLSDNVIDECDQLLVHIMSQVDRFDHLLFRNLIGSGLDHDHLLRGGSNSQIQIPVFPLFLGRIDDEFTVNHSHLGHGAGTVKRNIRNACGDCGTDHGNQLRPACRVHGHHQVIQGHIIAVILREQRAHGTVDDTACKNRVLAGLSLSLVKAAGNLSHGIHLFFIFYAEGEEINTLPRLLACGCGGQHGGIPIVHESRSIRLCGYSADIHAQRASGELDGKCLVHLVTPFPESLSFLRFRQKMPKLLTGTLFSNVSVSGLGKSFCPEQPVCRIRRPVLAYAKTASALFVLTFSVQVSRSGNDISQYPSSSDNQACLFSVLPSSEVLFWNDDPWGCSAGARSAP